MRRYKILAVLACLMLVLTSCNIVDETIFESVSPPTLKTAPINGKWNVAGVINLVDGSKMNSNNNAIGEEALFDISGIVIMDEYVTQPNFSIKRVNGNAYLNSKYDMPKDTIKFVSDKVEVITIYNKDQVFNEIIMDTDNIAYMYKSNTFYKLIKDDETIKENDFKEYIRDKIALAQLEEMDSINSNNGLLLGLKTYSYDEKHNLPGWKYSTLFVNFTRNTIVDLESLDGIIVPRATGLWDVHMHRLVDDKKIEDELVGGPVKVQPMPMEDLEEASEGDEDKVRIAGTKNIEYVSPMYVSVEETINVGNNEKRDLRIYGLDELAMERPLALSQIIKDGDRLYSEAQKLNDVSDARYEVDEKNIGVHRINGNWGIRGRINYFDNGVNQIKDFSILSKLPAEMSKQDTLNLKIEEVRKIIPNINDVFVSPNGQNLVVISGDEIRVYARVNGVISRDAYHVVKIPGNTSVVMSEWTAGKATENWAREVEMMVASKNK